MPRIITEPENFNFFGNCYKQPINFDKMKYFRLKEISSKGNFKMPFRMDNIVVLKFIQRPECLRFIKNILDPKEFEWAQSGSSFLFDRNYASELMEEGLVKITQ